MKLPATSKTRFEREFAINASPKILYPYLSTAAGLNRWFAQTNKTSDEQVFNFIWDKTDHPAIISNLRANKSVKFTYLDDEGKVGPDASYLEFGIETSQLTGEQFLKVVDYTAEQDEEELDELWEKLIQSLREIVGG